MMSDTNVMRMPFSKLTDRLVTELKAVCYEYVGQLNVAEVVGCIECAKFEILGEQRED